jgi:hypothetical protein
MKLILAYGRVVVEIWLVWAIMRLMLNFGCELLRIAYCVLRIRAIIRNMQYAIVFFLFLTACGGNDTPTDLPPDEIVARAAARMEALPGFRFVIDRSGAPAFVDPDQTISFGGAVGDYVAPDRARATVRVILPGLVTELNVISIGAVQWETNVATGQWDELPPNWGFNPAALFDQEVGLPTILAEDLTEAALVGAGKIGGMELYLLTGTVAGERPFRLSNGLIGPEPLAAQLWIAPETFELHRLVVTEAAVGADEPSVWQIDFSEFERVVEIAPPVLESE